MATVLIALGEAHSERNLLDGEWIAYATVECYLHFDGSGGGEAAVLGILEQFVDWLSREWRLEAWLRRKLHHELDDAREVHGLARRHPAVVDRPFGAHELEVLTTRFVETAGLAMHPISRSMSGSGVRYLHSLAAAHHGDAGGGWARFGSIDLDTTLAEALTFNQFEELHGDVPGPTETFLEIGAHFYRWLAAEGYLDPERADEIAHRFSLSLSLEPRFTPAA